VTDQNARPQYVWGYPSLTIDDAPDDRRLLFAIRLSLFRVARCFAYTRRGRALGCALAVVPSLTGAAAVLALVGSFGWAFLAGCTGPAVVLVLWRHRGIWVSGTSAEITARRRGSCGAAASSASAARPAWVNATYSNSSWSPAA
jgi:hypothetical protein